MIGADPGTILAAVTPVPDTLSEYQFAGPAARQEGRAGRLQDRAAEGAGRGRDRARGPCQPRRLRRRGPLRRPHRLLQLVEQFPVFTISAITMRRKPIYLSTFTGRPPDEPSVLGEALNEVFIPLLPAAVPRDRRLLAAARGLLLPHRRGVDEEGLCRPRQARDDGRVELSAAVHVHQVGDRRGRRHRRARLEGRDVGAVDPHGPGARHHRDREHADRLSRLRQPRSPASAPRSASTPPTSSPARAIANGAGRSAWTTR